MNYFAKAGEAVDSAGGDSPSMLNYHMLRAVVFALLAIAQAIRDRPA